MRTDRYSHNVVLYITYIAARIIIRRLIVHNVSWNIAQQPSVYEK